MRVVFSNFQMLNEYFVQRHAEVPKNIKYEIGIKKQIARCKYLNLKHNLQDTQNRK